MDEKKNGSSVGGGQPSKSPARATPSRLGKGLSALMSPRAAPSVPRGTVELESPSPGSTAAPISGGNPTVIKDQSSTPKGEDPKSGVAQDGLVLLDAKAIKTNPSQPRERFEPTAIATLAKSIRENGLLQPVLVRRVEDRWELIAGERRLRAAIQAGMTQVPAIVQQLSDQQSAEWALIENIQREDLNPIERAKGIQRLIAEFHLTHQQAAEKVGLERASVSNLLRLLDLDRATAALVAAGSLGQGHAKVLLAIPDSTLREGLAKQAVARQWSVRRLETEVRRIAGTPTPTRPGSIAPAADRSPANLGDLERRLSEYLGTRVQLLVGRRKGHGRLMIDFHGLEHFDDLMSRIGFESEE